MAIIDGTSGNDALFGTRLGDEINGLGGNDVLRGRRGGDRLNGGAGADEMRGRFGDDLYFVNHKGDRVGERFGEGTDTVYATLAYRLQQHIENLVLIGTAKIGRGNDLDNRLDASDQQGAPGSGVRAIANILDGGSGADVMAGGYGRDTYYVDNAGDTIEEMGSLSTAPNSGPPVADDSNLDQVFSSITYILPSRFDEDVNVHIGVENLILTGTADLSGTGNAVQNQITGNDGNNLLRGLGGADNLSGGDGNDRLEGGDGSDVLNGGVGNDILIGGEGGTTFRFDSFDADTTDWKRGDTIRLDVKVFTELRDFDNRPSRSIDEEAFTEATSASQADHRIIYNSASGELFYDPDGSGAQAQVLFATVNPGSQMFWLDLSTYG
ncbi:calcium-binding protein [Enterovirga sp. GCM10030262]|uniref:calcium-binding protein n=1 Tax=Enterovirga sp. GCM10030262 TaxID=3273391 RepID=UPI0036157B42